MTELDKLVQEINGKGWLVSSLYQPGYGTWCASVRDFGHYCSGYGQGKDPVAALADAWAKHEPDAVVRRKQDQDEKRAGREERVRIGKVKRSRKVVGSK